MKQMTFGLLVMMAMVFTFDHGMAQNSSASTTDNGAKNVIGLDDFLFKVNQEIRSQLHALTDECISDVAKIPSDQKIKYCQEQKQELTASYQQAESIGQGQQHPVMERQLETIIANFGNCQSNADEPLIERCKSIENAANQGLIRVQ